MACVRHSLLFLLGMSFLVNETAAVSGGLEDTLALVQQRAQLAPQSSSVAALFRESIHSNPKDQEDFIGKVIGKVGEERLQEFWKKMIEIGQRPNISRPQRGLLLLQESDKIIGAADSRLRDFLYGPKAWLMASSEPITCGLTILGVLTDIGDFTVSIAFLVGTKCSEPYLCTASWFDILRALTFTLRDLTASRSFCAESVSTGKLCLASKMGVFGETLGIVHSSVSLKIKCTADKLASTAPSGKIFGIDARKFMCGFDITRGSVYALNGIYRAFYWWWLGGSEEEESVEKDGNDDGNDNDDEEVVTTLFRHELEIGWSAPTYAFMAIGGFAWMTQSIIATVTNCPDNAAATDTALSACGKEAAELIAYLSQSVGYLNNYLDYCKDLYGKNDLRKKAGNEEEFRRMVTEQWQLVLTKVEGDLVPEDELILADEVLSPEAAEIVKKEVRKSISINRPRKPSMDPKMLDAVIQKVRLSIDDTLEVPQQRGSRLSVYKPRTSSASGNTMLEVPNIDDALNEDTEKNGNTLKFQL